MLRTVAVLVDLSDADHQDAILAMMEGYSLDPMGDAKPLSHYARSHLISGLEAHLGPTEQ